MENVIAGATISLATDKTATCHFLKTSFSYTAPVFTDTGKDSFHLKPGFLKNHHLSVTQRTRDLDESLGVVSDWIKPNGHGCTN